MIKGDLQISEPAMNLPPIQLHKNLNSSFSTEEKTIKTAVAAAAAEGADKTEVTNHFARLKRRMRSRSSNIL